MYGIIHTDPLNRKCPVHNLLYRTASNQNLEYSAEIKIKFKPSLKILSRIIHVMLEKNCIKKTSLSQEANIQYTRLLKHLDWLEKKYLVESVIEEGKVGIILTSKGREFAALISEF